MPTDLTFLLWLIAGVVLCVMEFTLPTAFVELTLGISAIIVAIVSLAVPQFTIQVIIWLVLSVLLTIVARRLMPKSTPYAIRDASEAKALTEIPPGQVGRVLYEGGSWQARCDDEQIAIAPDEMVYVVSRKGNTLIVLPERLLRS